MALGQLWAGKFFGTNTGNLFLKLEGPDSGLTGILKFNEDDVRILTFRVEASFDGTTVALAAHRAEEPPATSEDSLILRAVLNDKGQLLGEWERVNGGGGTLILFPHTEAQPPLVENTVEAKDATASAQLYTARYNFKAIVVDRNDITKIADNIQSTFKSGKVVITVSTNTEQSMLLEDFRRRKFDLKRATIIKIFAQEPEGNGINRIESLEFGPQVNFATVQSSDESWALGQLEILKQQVRKSERAYATNIKRLGISFNQLIIILAFIYLPSIPGFVDRLMLMFGITLISGALDSLHKRWIPFAIIYIEDRPPSLFMAVGSSLVSWLIAATAGIAATLLAAYLQGYLHLGGR